VDKKETKEKLDNITQTLQQLMEQTQVKASLLKLESQDAWQDVEKGFFKIKSYLEKDWEKTKEDVAAAQVQANLGIMEVKEDWDQLKDYLSEAITSLNAKEKFDRTKLQAHLAKMDAEDRFKEKRKKWAQDYESLKPQIKSSLEKMQKDMETMVKSLRN